MDDDLKKTILQPRFANRMSYHTVVMDRPPMMMSERPVPAHTTVKTGNDPRVTSIAALRTRMVSAQATPDFDNEKPLPPPLPTHVPPGLGPLPPPQSSGSWNAPLLEPKTKRQDVVRKGVIVGGAAIVLGICLVLPFSGNEKNSQAASISAAPAESASMSAESTAPASAVTASAVATTDAVPKSRERHASPSALPTAAKSQTPVTAERAGSLLLAGRRREALVAYRQLADSPASTPGIRAMVEVLAQKVDAP